jgi:hypothetical protein
MKHYRGLYITIIGLLIVAKILYALALCRR